MFSDGLLLHTYKDGNAKQLGFLDDYAFLAVGLLDFYEATLERSLLDRAVELTENHATGVLGPSEGGFFLYGELP